MLLTREILWTVTMKKTQRVLFIMLLIPVISLVCQGSYYQVQATGPTCTDAVFPTPLPHSFQTGTSIPFTVNFGTTFPLIGSVTAYSYFDSADPFNDTDEFDITDQSDMTDFGGHVSFIGESFTELPLISLDQGDFGKFSDGKFSGSYDSLQGSFTLKKLTFCLQEPIASFDVPPSPANGTTFHVQTGDNISFKVQCSGPAFPSKIYLTTYITGLPEGAIFPTEKWPTNFINGNPVSGTFSWTPATAQTSDVIFYCEENNTAAYHTITIDVTDKTSDNLFCGKPASAYAHVINGTNGNNVLVGTNENDLILGNGGNDTITGNGGDDCILGGAGNDIINGGSGDDNLVGGPGNDTINGSTGNDIIDGGTGNDNLIGGPGNDTINGSDGNDVIDGGTGDDKIYGGNGNDTINGSDGNDYLQGSAGDDKIYGGAGDDEIHGGAGDDYINGGDGTDKCFDSLGTNTKVNCES